MGLGSCPALDSHFDCAGTCFLRMDCRLKDRAGESQPFSLFFFALFLFFLKAFRAHRIPGVIDLMLNGGELPTTNRTGHHINHEDTPFLIDANILYEYQKFVKGARA